MATNNHYRTTVISTGSNRTANRLSLISMASLERSSSHTGSIISTEAPILITTTVTTTTRTFPAPALPPFATSLGSDDPLPRPRRGAPPVEPARRPDEPEAKPSLVRKLRLAMRPQRKVLHPALCEGWD